MRCCGENRKQIRSLPSNYRFQQETLSDNHRKTSSEEKSMPPPWVWAIRVHVERINLLIHQ